jgi:hypothetical protein
MWALFPSASMQGCQSQKTRSSSTASDKSVCKMLIHRMADQPAGHFLLKMMSTQPQSVTKPRVVWQQKRLNEAGDVVCGGQSQRKHCTWSVAAVPHPWPMLSLNLRNKHHHTIPLRCTAPLGVGTPIFGVHCGVPGQGCNRAKNNSPRKSTVVSVALGMYSILRA